MIKKLIDTLEPRRLLSVSVGTDGWTNLGASSDSRMIHVSSSGGNDSNPGTLAKPIKSLAKARTLVRDKMPDWVLLKRGDTFNESFPDWVVSGRSASEMSVITAYGTGARPKVFTGSNGGITIAQKYSNPVNHVAVVGLHFHANTYNGSNGSFKTAGIRVLRFLKEIAPLDQEQAYKTLFEAGHIGGAGIGIAGSDDVSDDLTCNLGIVETAGTCARLTFNIRYPVTWNGGTLRDRIVARLARIPAGPSLVSFSDSPPLYFPIDHPLVQTILDVHEAETGARGVPGVMGGGTYARAISNTVSVGTGWEGDGNAHETDERLKIDNLFRMSRIYAHILYRLALA